MLAAVRTYGVDACITRGANTYGPNQYPEKLIPLFITNALDGEPLPVYGDGRQRREWLHVDDHCAGDRARAARGAPRRDLQRRRRQEHENIEVAQRILELTGATPTSSATSTTGPATTAATRSTTRSCARSAGRRERSFERAGSRETVDWYRDNRAWWEPIKSGEYRAYYEQQYAERLALALLLLPRVPPLCSWPCLSCCDDLGGGDDERRRLERVRAR